MSRLSTSESRTSKDSRTSSAFAHTRMKVGASHNGLCDRTV
ncbi:uncharacterized protein M6B38_415940 [Iris pallida]|uniref:Uncharacterized protein n=1 Tax=Iris pallida TaxID=29817 RepID=A0AAX6FKD6_IRIPA|nr:uncharacterized protein M6B38_415940 [Iris pallida]